MMKASFQIENPDNAECTMQITMTLKDWQCLNEQRLQYEQLQLRSAEYFHKTKREEWEKAVNTFTGYEASREPTDEEIELELLQRKEALKGGLQQ